MNEQVQEIFVEDIIPNRFQPRLTFDEKALQELADSIKVHGVIQPLVLRKVGNKYEIIAGERRYKASCMAGLKKVPAIVREMTDNESAEVALIENVQRKNLSSIEEAQSYKNLLQRGYITQEELAQKLGVSQSTIANKLRLLNLCDEVQNALLNEQISERHARSLLQFSNPDDQKSMLNRIIKERLTVKQLDAEIKKKLQGTAGGTETATATESSGTGNVSNDGETGGTIMNPVENPNSKEQNTGNVNSEPNKNIFGFSIEPPTDLETSAPNLNVGIEENVPPVSFNPFSPTPQASAPIEPTPQASEQIETFDMFGDVVTPNSPAPTTPFSFGTPEEQTVQENKRNIGDQITDIRETAKKAEAAGFRVEMEEYDFEDMYQIIIKIKK